MNVLIVGCGYLGKTLADLLVELGYQVHVTTRSPHKARTLNQELGVKSLVLDLTKPATLDALPSVDAVVHCVAYDRNSGHSRAEVSVLGLQNLLSAIPPTTQRFISTSSTSVYGDPDLAEITEDTPPEPNSESGRVCLNAEQALTNQAARFQTCAILRLSGIYGPGRIIRRDSLLRGDPIPTDPDSWINLIHVADAAAAIVAVLQAEAQNSPLVLNVSDDDPGPRRRLYRLSARLLNAPEPVFIPTATDERTSRRKISNARLKASFLPRLNFPSIEQGIPAALAAEDTQSSGRAGPTRPEPLATT